MFLNRINQTNKIKYFQNIPQFDIALTLIPHRLNSLHALTFYLNSLESLLYFAAIWSQDLNH